MEYGGKSGLVLSIIGAALVVTSFWVCGWLGFVGAVLGVLAICLNQGRASAVIVGLVDFVVGCIFGGMWVYAITQIL